MFRKATPTLVRHLRRGASSRVARVGAKPAAQRIALASSSVLSGSAHFSTQFRFKSSVAAVEDEVCVPTVKPPFKKILAANRGEIATRICRAGAELGCITTGIYSYEGMFQSFIEWLGWLFRLRSCSGAIKDGAVMVIFEEISCRLEVKKGIPNDLRFY